MRSASAPLPVHASIPAESQATAPAAAQRPIPARASYTDPEAEVLPWTGLSLLVALAGLFLLIAFPGSERAAASPRALDPEEELELVTALAQFRRAVVAYRADQGDWPGADEEAGSPLHAFAAGDAWQAWFERNVSSEAERAGAGPLVVDELEPLADYLPGGEVPVNVVNGLGSVRVLLFGEAMPKQPDGGSGWILDPRTGDLRVNALGRLRDSGRALFDL